MRPYYYAHGGVPFPDLEVAVMNTLHAAVDEVGLALWAEAPGAGRRPSRAAIPSLPFASGPDKLRELVQELWPFWDAVDVRRQVLWVPSGDAGPTPPDDAPGADLASRAIRPFRVAAASVPSTWWPMLFGGQTRDGGARHLGGGVWADPVWDVWSALLALAESLVVRHQYWPSTRRVGPELYAHWTPDWAPRDRERAASLARRLPGAARALTRDATGAPARDPALVAEWFVAAAVDRLVRDSSPPLTLGASIHDRWCQALVADDGRLGGSPAELAGLETSVAQWARPLVALAALPFRLVFRVVEPDPEDDQERWRIDFRAVSLRDPSLSAGLSALWDDFTAQHRGLGDPWDTVGPDQVLLALGQAAAVSPSVREALAGPAPSHLATDLAGAYRFLTEDAPLLEQAGFGLELPGWWHGAASGVKTRAHVEAPMAVPGRFNLDAIISVNWQAVLGDEVLTPEELERLATSKTPLVQIRGAWVHVRAEDALRILRRVQHQSEMRARDAMRLAMGATLGPDADDTLAGATLTGWLKELMTALQGEGAAARAAAAPPQAFVGSLRPYQARGLAWLTNLASWGLGGLLADDMGLGKTVQTLALIEALAEHDAEPRPVLLVAPPSILGNWEAEARRFTPSLPVAVHHGSDRAAGEELLALARRTGLVLTSYGTMRRDAAPLATVPWRAVIADEAQAVKNFATRTFRALASIPADFRVALTGTPVENHVGDLYSLIDLVNPGWLGAPAQFRRQFLQPIHREHREEPAQRLRDLTAPFILRRTKTDPAIAPDLPDKIEMVQFCQLTTEQAALYRAVVAELEERLYQSEGMERRGVILTTLLRLKQLANHPAHFLADGSPLPGRSGKLERLESLVDEILDNGERALIFSQFREMGALLQHDLQERFGRSVLFLHGGVPRTERDRQVAQFQRAEGGPPLFILSLNAGGTGLNLTRANHVLHYDRWWNPAVENQATDRAFRIGQAKAVRVHKFVTRGTVEERIHELLVEKQGLADRFVGGGGGGGEQWLTEWSNNDVLDLFRLQESLVEV